MFLSMSDYVVNVERIYHTRKFGENSIEIYFGPTSGDKLVWVFWDGEGQTRPNAAERDRIFEQLKTELLKLK